MKFREEVVAKIFTYITVIILLGIVAFEAYLLQTERARRKEAQEVSARLEVDLSQVRELNFDLESRNEQLQAFYLEWAVYAAFDDSQEVELYRGDLFSRTDLIPEEAFLAWQEREAAGQEQAEDEAAQEQEEEPKQKETEQEGPEQEQEETRPVFTFENPEGGNVFLPFGAVVENGSRCVVYTAAFSEADGRPLELLYEIAFEDDWNTPVTDENGEIVWKCIAFNIGEGWTGIAVGEEEDDEEH